MPDPLKFLYTNADSLHNKLHELSSLASKDNLDVICVTETLPKTKRTLDSVCNLPLNNYTDYNCNTGRGVTIYVNDRIRSELVNFDDNFKDQIWVRLEITPKNTLLIGGIYRSPNSEASNNDHLIDLFDKLTTINNTDILIMGDFNFKEIDWINMTVATRTEHPAYKLFNKINDAFLHQVVTEPTRHRRGQTANLLDWVLTNFPEKILDLQVLAPLGQKGDHNVITFNYDMPRDHQNNTLNSYCYSKGDYVSMNKELEKETWADISNQTQVESSWNNFQAKITKLMNKYIPKQGGIKRKSQPWMNQEIREALKEKNRAWKKYRQQKSDQLWNAFTLIRNSTNRIIKERKAQYENSLAKEIKLNPKKFWNYINIKRNSNREFPIMQDSEGKSYTTDIDKANQFNKYFGEVFTTESLTMVPSLLPRSDNHEISEIQVNNDVIARALNKIDISKSAGPDLIHSRVIHELRAKVAYPLCQIFQKSLDEGKLPTIWKQAHIKPIHKKGKKSHFSNYRPVSLTSVCGKILERIIRDRIVAHLESHKLINQNQHGFRTGRSCVTQLLEIMEIWTDLLDKGISFDCVYLDFSKAFDKVPHERLLNKIQAYGIRGKLHRWIRDFLNNRQQIVKINNESSTTLHVKSGIPQGSVLGPILFILYINDLPDQINSNLKIFADDTKIFRAVQSLEDKSSLETDLAKLIEWSTKWQLPFNVEKCKVIHYGSLNPNNRYRMGNAELTTDLQEKDLGVVFDNKIKFDLHINQIIAKANSRLGLIRYTFTELPASTLLPLYKSIVRPILEYAVAIWKPHLKKDIDGLEKVQRRATKLVKGIKHLTYPERLKHLKLDSLTFRRRRNDMLQVFRILNKIDNLDKKTFFSPGLSASTRGHSAKLAKPRARTNARLHTFSHRTINDWNNLKQDTVACKTLNSFKNALLAEWKNHPERFFETK